MLHTCLPVFDKIGVGQVFLFHVVGSYTTIHRITDLDLLVPLFLTGYFAFLVQHFTSYLFERIDTRHIHRQFRCGQRDSGVFRTLRDAGGCTQTPRTVRKTLLVTDRTALRVLRHQRRVVITVDITAAITAGREVNTCRECTVRIEFRILRMGPLNLEVLADRIIRQALLTGYIVSVTDIDITPEMVTPDVFRLRPNCPGSFGVYIAHDLQVHVVIDGKIVSSVG